MKEVVEVILENIQYVYPGFIALSLYEYITIGSDSEDTERFFLKIVCISYVMVKIVTPIWSIIFNEDNATENNLKLVLIHLTLVLLSIALPVFFYRIRSSKSIKKILKWFHIPIDTSENLGIMILKNCPVDYIVYITIYLENYVYAGVLSKAEMGENGFFSIEHWKKINLNHGDGMIESAKKRNHESVVVVPQESIQHYFYEYLDKNAKLPDIVI